MSLADKCMSPVGVIVLLIVVIIVLFGYEESKVAVANKISSLTSPTKVTPVVAQTAEDDEEVPVEAYSQMEEGFNNDLYNPDVELENEDYETALKLQVLEPEVVAQHQKFNEELMHRVGGTSSRSSVRDDNTDVVPWIGLKRPAYQKINPNAESARTVPSVMDADDLADYATIAWSRASGSL